MSEGTDVNVFGLGGPHPDHRGDRAEGERPVDEPPGEPLEQALAAERDTPPLFRAPVEVAQQSREQSLEAEAEADDRARDLALGSSTDTSSSVPADHAVRGGDPPAASATTA